MIPNTNTKIQQVCMILTITIHQTRATRRSIVPKNTMRFPNYFFQLQDVTRYVSNFNCKMSHHTIARRIETHHSKPLTITSFSPSNYK